MNTTEVERQLGSSRPNQDSGSEVRFDPELPARLIEKLEQLQLLQAELLGKAQAWNRIALISETDATGTILAVNDNFIRTSGYTRDELLGQSHNLLKSGHQHDSIFEQMWLQLKAGKVWRGYLKNKSQKGDYFWVYSTIFPILDEKRTPIRFYSVALPVTELIEPSDDLKLNLLPAFALSPDAQLRQLQQLRQQLHTIKREHDHALRAVHQALSIAETDSRGIITAVNDHLVEVSGYERHELVGQNHRLLKSPEQNPAVYDELWSTITQGLTWRGLLINRTKQGIDYRVEIQIMPELDEEGRIRRYLSLSWPLGEEVERAFADAGQLMALRVEVEQLAQRYEESQQHIAELEVMQRLLFSQVSALNASAFVLEIDLLGQISFVNDAFINRTGFQRESLFGQPWTVLLDSTDHSQELASLERSLNAREPWQGFLPVRKAEGGWFWCYLVLHPVENPDTGAVDKFILIFTDARASKQRILELEQEITMIRAQEQEQQRTVSDLFYKTTQLQRILQEKESRQVGLEQSFPVIETDPTGIVLFVNDVFCRQYATRPADWMGKGFDSWLSTRVPANVADTWLIESRTVPLTPLRLPALDFDMLPTAFLAYSCPIYDSEGNWVKQLYLLVPEPEQEVALLDTTPKPAEELISLQQANELLNAQVAQLQQQLASQAEAAAAQQTDQQQVIDKLQAELAALRDQPHGSRGFVAEEVYQAAVMARETLEQRIVALVRDKEANYANFQKALEANQKLQGQFDKLVQELEDERRWAAELQERYAQLERDFRSLESDSENRNAEIEELNRRYANLEQLNEEVVLNMQELRNQLRDLQLELEFAQEQSVKHKRVFDEQTAELDGLRRQVEKLSDDKLSVEAELGSAQLRIEKLSKERIFLSSEIESLTNRLEKQKQENRFLESEIESLKTRLEQQAQERRFAESEIEAMQNRLEKQLEERRFVENELESIKDRLEKIYKEKYWLEEELRDLKHRLGEEFTKRARLEEEVRDYRSEVDNLELRLGRQDAERKSLLEERDRLSNRILLLEQEAELSRHQLESVGDQVQFLTFTNERLAATIRELEQQLRARSPQDSSSVSELREWVGFSPPEPKSAVQKTDIPILRKVLFVEADFTRLETVKSWMTSWGLDCKISARGDDALALYESFRPDVVFVELRLPGLNGFELTDVIRNDYEDLKTLIVALTPSELLAHRNEYLRSGFSEVVGKPYSQADLEQVLRLINLLS
jgi:PAS domain S-box-containing protein